MASSYHHARLSLSSEDSDPSTDPISRTLSLPIEFGNNPPAAPNGNLEDAVSQTDFELEREFDDLLTEHYGVDWAVNSSAVTVNESDDFTTGEEEPFTEADSDNNPMTITGRSLAYAIRLLRRHLEIRMDHISGTMFIGGLGDDSLQMPGERLTDEEIEQFLGQLAQSESLPTGVRPASNEAIQSLPLIQFEGKDYECSVCKDEAETGEHLSQLPCGHLYHKNCIQKWLAIRNTCPLCRYELPTESQVPVAAVETEQLFPDLPLDFLSVLESLRPSHGSEGVTEPQQSVETVSEDQEIAVEGQEVSLSVPDAPTGDQQAADNLAVRPAWQRAVSRIVGGMIEVGTYALLGFMVTNLLLLADDALTTPTEDRAGGEESTRVQIRPRRFWFF